MRVLVFFDLPTETFEDRKRYSRFRKTLLKNGFLMMQESVYAKLALNATVVNSIINAIKKEKPVVFDRFSQSLISSKLGENEDIFLINDQRDKILLSKQANVIYPPFRNIYSINKDMQKKVYTEVLSNIRSTNAEEKLLRLQMEEKEIIKNICFEMNYNLELNEEVNCETILKPCNIRIKESEGTFAIRVLDYAVNSEEMFGFNFLFLVSCSDYIDTIEYDKMLRNLRYHDIIITVVAGTQSRQLNIEKNEYIIDYDRCVLK